MGWRADSKAAASAYAWFNLFLRLRLLLVGTAGTKLTTAAIAVNNNISGDEDRNMNERYKLKLVPMQRKVRKRSVDQRHGGHSHTTDKSFRKVPYFNNFKC